MKRSMKAVSTSISTARCRAMLNHSFSVNFRGKYLKQLIRSIEVVSGRISGGDFCLIQNSQVDETNVGDDGLLDTCRIVFFKIYGAPWSAGFGDKHLQSHTTKEIFGHKVYIRIAYTILSFMRMKNPIKNWSRVFKLV